MFLVSRKEQIRKKREFDQQEHENKLHREYLQRVAEENQRRQQAQAIIDRLEQEEKLLEQQRKGCWSQTKEKWNNSNQTLTIQE